MGGWRVRRPSDDGRTGPSGDQSQESGGAPARGEAGTAVRYLPRFFVDASQLTGPPSSPSDSPTGAIGRELHLDPDDARHALNVLRLRPGDQCEVVVVPTEPGRALGGMRGGTAYLATVTGVTEEVRVTPVAPLEGRQAGASYATAVGIVQSMVRPAAMDYLMEKGTEVGASFFLIVPASGSRSHGRPVQPSRLERWRRIVREAAKQSKQLAIPSVEVSGSVEEGLLGLGPEVGSLVLVPDAPDGLHQRLWPTSGAARRSLGLALWIGSESGWTAEDRAILRAAGAKEARLGQGVLRAETAGPVALAVARLALGDW